MLVDPIADILKRINDYKPVVGDAMGMPTKLVDEMFFMLTEDATVSDVAWMQISNQMVRKATLRSMACMLKDFCHTMGVEYP